APFEDVEHLVALVVAALAAGAVEAQQALLELRHREERAQRFGGVLGLRRVLHAASLYRSIPFRCRARRSRVAGQGSAGTQTSAGGMRLTSEDVPKRRACMLKRVGAIALIATALAVVASSVAWGSAKAPTHVNAAAAKSVKCGKKVTIGVAYPETGPAASLGTPQWDWANFAKKTWNKSHKLKIAFVPGDTQLAGNNPQAVQVAHAFASNKKILAVSGPAGSQEMEDTASVWVRAGLAPVSGSETRVALTRASTGTPRETKVGYFFRTVPNDGQQGDNVATFIHKKLKKTNVRIIDDEEAYSQGLSAQVKADLTKAGVTVTTDHISQQNPDYNSVIAAIPGNTQLVYIPWQVPAMAQQFFTQMRANGKNQVIMGSDGTDDPSTFKGAGSYVSG